MHTVAPVDVKYVPVPQSVHASDPIDVLNFPAKHVSQIETFQCKPASHAQTESPALQAMHVELTDAPVAAEYVPPPQLVHREAPTAVEYLPVPQFVHGTDPADDLYLPSTHTVQMPPFGPDEPALQMQFVKAALPAGEMEFDGQLMHVDDPTAVEYVPTSQTHVEVDWTLQEASNPERWVLLSDVNPTCMYPVPDV